jgi:localization factor PodJL
VEPARTAPVFGHHAADADLDMDIPLEPGTGGPGGRPVAPLGDSRPAPAAPRAAAAAPATADPRASFIAAARRAAQAAAAEAASVSPKPGPRVQRPDAAQVAAQKAPSRATSDGPSEGGALARVREVFERRRRPILLGLAAAVVALGTIQTLKQTFSGDEESASRIEPALSPDGVAGPPPLEAAPAAVPADAASKPQSSLLSPQTVAAAAPISRDTAARPVEQASTEVPSGVPSLGEAMISAPQPATADTTGAITGPPRRLLEAAKAGDPRGLYDLASRLADPKNPRRDLEAAAEHYQHAASKGFAPAQYRIASMYEKGLGVGKNLQLASSWYERAAANGNIKAMHNMAVLYAEGGIDGKPNYASAAQWFRKAAEYGLRDSEYNYAILVARGLGSAADLPQAYRWFAIAASQGDADAATKRDEVGARLDEATKTRLAAEVASFVPLTAPATANDTSLPPASWETAEANGV